MKTALVALFLLAALASHAEDPIRPDPRLTTGAVFSNVTVGLRLDFFALTGGGVVASDVSRRPVASVIQS